jgi:hypothetical protein
MKVEDILTIAGKAHRRRHEIEKHIATEKGVFPNGGDDLFYAAELSLCDTLLATARALLVPALLQLSFDHAGRAVATMPSILREDSNDEGPYQELV